MAVDEEPDAVAVKRADDVMPCAVPGRLRLRLRGDDVAAGSRDVEGEALAGAGVQPVGALDARGRALGDDVAIGPGRSGTPDPRLDGEVLRARARALSGSSTWSSPSKRSARAVEAGDPRRRVRRGAEQTVQSGARAVERDRPRALVQAPFSGEAVRGRGGSDRPDRAPGARQRRTTPLQSAKSVCAYQSNGARPFLGLLKRSGLIPVRCAARR